jgi:ABC-type Fe3+/spermidine/putrescine transport system ATPase subunit
MVFQSYALFPHMTVAGNVAFGLEVRHVPRSERDRRVKDALALVDLEGMERRLIHQISGGQQQRVALARALVLEPSLLLLDEPLSNLDAKIRQQTRLQLKGLQKRLGVTMLYVTHDQEEALALSDEVVLVNAGRIVQQAAPRELYEHPNSTFAAEFVGEGTMLRVERVMPGSEGHLIATGGLLLNPGLSGEALPAPPFDVLIRPEHVIFEPVGLANSFSGIVTTSLYEGETARHQVRVNGVDVKVASRVDPGAPVPRIGDTVAIGWRPEAMHILPGQRAI